MYFINCGITFDTFNKSRFHSAQHFTIKRLIIQTLLKTHLNLMPSKYSNF